MKCPHCGKTIKSTTIARHLASIGGKKSKRKVTPKQRDEKGRFRKMQEGKRRKCERVEIQNLNH